MIAIATDEELARAIERMRVAHTDLMEYELKSAAGGFPKEVAETVSAFSNSGGGTIIFGIRESRGFHPEAGFDPKATQANCAQVAREGVEPLVQADIRVLSFEGAPVVVVNVPDASSRQKPCYVRKYGQRGGSFIRTGDGDHRMTPYEVDRFIENQRSRSSAGAGARRRAASSSPAT
ncbi:MAG: ATP-binding protein [Coriobacteriia bacterium]|nr:ATP-binding protein [Coriobacteriia bacterium]MBS5477561.1 ATP-binding protein [Coriobacteriia bacterium]